MSFLAPPTTTETDALGSFLVQQCGQLRLTTNGLTEDQARLAPTAGSLSLAGLVAHVAQVVDNWLGSIEQAPEVRTMETATAAGANIGLNGFFSGEELPELPLPELLDTYDRVVAGIPERLAAVDLEARVPVPDAPWYPADLKDWNARWVLMHLVSEVARHAGHADIIREAIDGAISYQLNAEADGEQWDVQAD